MNSERASLLQTIGLEIVRFQDATTAVDDAAAQVLALERVDLQCVSMLLFVGAAPLSRIGAQLHLSATQLHSMGERLELAGYCRRVGEQLELTEHALSWIGTIWGPLAADANQVLSRQSTRDLRAMKRLLETIAPLHEAHGARIRKLLETPAPKPNRLRGGLSPAALRRVQLFIEANLGQPLRLEALAARAGLSAFHFARAFKVTMGQTPRAFVEARRIELARRRLLESTQSLADIALETGFGSQSRFTTRFRRATGFTPAQLRRGSDLSLRAV